MENTVQTQLLDAFRAFEKVLPDIARTGIFSRSAQRYTGINKHYRPIAEVVRKKRETADAVSLTLQLPEDFPASQAGEHIDLAVEIRGVRHVRQYSIVSREGSELQVTVKNQAGGLVSGFIHENIVVGSKIEISAPRGGFTLPVKAAKSYIFCSAGSGITPVFAMARELLASGIKADVQFFHAAHSADAVIFRAELEHLAERHNNFLPQFFLSEAEGVEKRRLNFATLQNLLGSELAGNETKVMLCGPGDFVKNLEEGFRSLGIQNIASEYYTLPSMPATTEAGQATFVRSRVEAPAAGNLLEAAEAAGLKPKHGCRRGICHECKAHKKSGMVKNILSGQLTQGEENIQLCVSQAVGKVEIIL
ncbi:MAG: 2Fe-2S iron-sulfur cluster binding domain-containing protein [Leptospiraceae bacterium]|nr:2Fe-2S iron-sulfur cluster binding domain-containing protein [Leptospiraceae bacterium]